MENFGHIDLENGFKFHWVRSGDKTPEISGFIEKPNGGTLKGSSGWYRTDDPQKAAVRASMRLN